jgi:8-oxo-dGTP diphosphatase
MVAFDETAPLSLRPGVGVGVLICRDDHVLLMKRKGAHGAGTWCPPGGALEHGESPEECAARETKEEVGLEIANVTFIAITNDIFPEGTHHVTIWMEAGHVVGEPRVCEPAKSSALAWFEWSALPSPRFIPFEHLLQGESYPPWLRLWRDSLDRRS